MGDLSPGHAVSRGPNRPAGKETDVGPILGSGELGYVIGTKLSHHIGVPGDGVKRELGPSCGPNNEAWTAETADIIGWARQEGAHYDT